MGFRHRRIQRTGAGGWPGHRLIKAAGTTAVLCTLAFSGPARAETTVSAHELQGKIDYCENCHGVAARGFHGFYPIPRLAGQQPEYIKNQLQAFIEHRRTNNIMFNVAHVLSPPLLDALTDSFWKLNPRPLASPAAEGLIAAGRKIYEEGIEKADVPPCAGCHGPEAKGNGQFPRLAGQLSDYIFNKLTNWTKERGQNPANADTSTIMAPIAHNLTDQQIKAVAAYLNHLE